MLKNKIDFVLYVDVNGANPNGDPLSGNMPRQDNELFGIISDVCIKRKIRNRLQDNENELFVVANERIVDGMRSLEARFESVFTKKDTEEDVYKTSCEKWIDVRSFGQVMTFQKRSIGIRGPVSVSMGKSVHPVTVTTMQITRSTNGMKAEEGKQRSSDTMGSKHYVEYGLYKICGSINPYFSERTGFSELDADQIKEALRTLFINDISSARPDGSMEVRTLYWAVHPSKLGTVSSAKIHDMIQAKTVEGVTIPQKKEDYELVVNEEFLSELKSKGLELEVIEGM